MDIYKREFSLSLNRTTEFHMTDFHAVFVDAFMKEQHRQHASVHHLPIEYEGHRVIAEQAARAGFAAVRKAYLYDPHADYEPQVSIFLSHMAGEK